MNVDFQENEVMPLLHGTLQFVSQLYDICTRIYPCIST